MPSIVSWEDGGAIAVGISNTHSRLDDNSRAMGAKSPPHLLKSMDIQKLFIT